MTVELSPSLAGYLPLAGGTLHGFLLFAGAAADPGEIGFAYADPGLMVFTTIADSEAYLNIQGHGNGVNNYPVLLLTRSRAALGAVLSGDFLGAVGASGVDTAPATDLGGSISFTATENWTAVGHGTKIVVDVTPDGTTTPVTAMTIHGSGVVAAAAVATGVVSITAASSPYTIPATVETVFVDTSAGAVTVTPPDGATVPGRRLTIKKTTADANAVTIDPAIGTIETAASVVLAGGARAQNQIQSDGTNWWITSLS